MTVIKASFLKSGTSQPLVGYLNVTSTLPFASGGDLNISTKATFPLVNGMVDVTLISTDQGAGAYIFDAFDSSNVLNYTLTARVPSSATPLPLSLLAPISTQLQRWDYPGTDLSGLANMLINFDPFVSFMRDGLFSTKGAWDVGITYKKNDVVNRLGSGYQYVYATPSIGFQPENYPTRWVKIVDKGDPGIQGIQGIPGIPGAGGGGGGTNPLTTLGDIFVGGISGSPDRLGVGTTNQVLGVVAGKPGWVTPSAPTSLEPLIPFNCQVKAFKNSWVNYTEDGTQQKLTFTLSDGLVYFSGRLRNPTNTDNSTDTVAIFPNGYEAAGSGGGAAGYLDAASVVALANYGINAPGGSAPGYLTLYRNTGGICGILDISGSYVSKGNVSSIYYKALPLASEEMTITFPKTVNPKDPLKVCFYFHGAGDTYDSHFTGVDTATSTFNLLRSTLNALIADGWVVVTHKGGNNPLHWGNNESDLAVTAAIAWLKSTFNITKMVALGQSMGGLSSLRALSKNASITNWYGIYPVCNLDNMKNNAAYGGGVTTAYGGQAGYDVAKANTDPMLIPATLFAGKKMRAIASSGDTVVPRAQHSDLFKTRIAGVVTLTVDTHTGDHGDTTAFQPAQVVAHFNS